MTVMNYAELHCKSNFSFLEGASHPSELVERAAALNYAALALTDRNSLAGVVRAHTAAKDVGLKLVIGAEVTPRDAAPVVLWVTDRSAYGRLCRLLTLGRRRVPKGNCDLSLEDLAAHAEGLLAGVLFERERQFSLPQLRAYRDIFGDNCYLLAELYRGPDDERRLRQLTALGHRARVPLLAAGGVLYHTAARLPLHDVMTAIRHGTTVAEAGGLLLPNSQRHLQSLERMTQKFSQARDALRRTVEVAARCQFSLDELRYEYPEELAPDDMTPLDYLKQLTWAGAAQHYPQGIPEHVRQLLCHELELIEDLRYESYFLTVWDLVRFARSRAILCQGRGSAANSAVCFCLGITAVDPEETDMLFERFVSRERNEAPDIDVDFEHERREEVLQYLYGKYGRERAGLTATVIKYRSRSAIRDVGKALGLSLDRVDAMAKNLDGHPSQPTDLQDRCRQIGLEPRSETGRRLLFLVQELIGMPRHLSQHVGGMVCSRGPLCELVPLENAAMPERTVIQWDKDDLDELGILKVDCLALGMLSAIRKGFELIERHHQRQLTLADVPKEDPAVYAMIRRADTMGVFQIESRAQMSILPRLQPRQFYDLVISIGIVRPGPIKGGAMQPYLRRRVGEEPVSFPNEASRVVLEKTLGVILFQEQAMRLAMLLAGFSAGEADQLRRAMGAWRRPGIIDQFRQRLLAGMASHGVSQEIAEQVFQQIQGFGEYGFPESHSVSFAKLAYISAWMKCHYQAEFTASLINSQPMGFYAVAQLIADARKHAVRVLPIDVNFSTWDCTIEALQVIRLGFRLVNGLSSAHVSRIARARDEREFASLDDFVRRTALPRAVVRRLAEADAFASLRHHRRAALWEALGQERHAVSQPLFAGLDLNQPVEPVLPAMSPCEEVFADYHTTGLSLRAHPISFYRSELQRLQVVSAEQLATLENDRYVRVAGIVLLRQRPSTAQGITFCTLEDETDNFNLVVFPAIWNRYRQVACRSVAWIAHGQLERKRGVIHIVVQRVEDLAARMRPLPDQSRDFR